MSEDSDNSSKVRVVENKNLEVIETIISEGLEAMRLDVERIRTTAQTVPLNWSDGQKLNNHLKTAIYANKAIKEELLANPDREDFAGYTKEQIDAALPAAIAYLNQLTEHIGTAPVPPTKEKKAFIDDVEAQVRQAKSTSEVASIIEKAKTEKQEADRIYKLDKKKWNRKLRKLTKDETLDKVFKKDE